MKTFPILKTQRLVLREFALTDAAAVLDSFTREKVTRFHNVSTMLDIEEAKALVKARKKAFTTGRGIRWAIALREHGRQGIGSCGYYNFNRSFHSAEIGYDLHPDFWGRGIMTEALTAIIDFGYSDPFDFHLNRIQALTHPENRASIALLRRLGFHEEGLLRAYGFWKDSYQDVQCFSLLRSEWPNGRPQTSGPQDIGR
ncbi:MAG: GNAT family N-acetyltransferase [Anaerolineae bacterium]|nr:GNAT family N-acetyltransferase [Anaerolineae bacterium]